MGNGSIKVKYKPHYISLQHKSCFLLTINLNYFGVTVLVPEERGGFALNRAKAVNTHKHNHTSEQTYPEQWAAQEMPLGWGERGLAQGYFSAGRREKRNCYLFTFPLKTHLFPVGSENQTRDLLVSVPLL